MKLKTLLLLNLACAFSLIVFIGSSVIAQTAPTQDKDKATVSDAETKAATAIRTAPDVAAKLVAAGEFLKKHSKSTLRPQIAQYIASQIGALSDAAQRLTYSESFQKLFTAESERALIQPVIIFGYVEAKKIDEAFTLAASVLAKDPENINVLVQMNVAATDAAKNQNPKYLAVGRQYGLKAIEIIEANRKPPNMEEVAWAEEKTRLPRLYQNIGLLSLVGGDSAEAKARVEKSAVLNPADPFNYFLLGSIANDEYALMAQAYKALPEGKEKAETLKKATDLMDKVVDLYARAAGLSEGRPEFKQLYDQALQDLTPYYKYRHNGSTEGIQQLVDKYKTALKP